MRKSGRGGFQVKETSCTKALKLEQLEMLKEYQKCQCVCNKLRNVECSRR